MSATADVVLGHLVDVLQRHSAADEAEPTHTGSERMAALLGASCAELPKVGASIGPVRATNVASALDALAGRYLTAEVAASSNGPEPSRRRIGLAGHTRVLPVDSLIAWPAGALDPDVGLVTLAEPASCCRAAAASPSTTPLERRDGLQP